MTRAWSSALWLFIAWALLACEPAPEVEPSEQAAPLVQAEPAFAWDQPVPGQALTQGAPVMAAGGDQALVVYPDTRNGPGLFAARIRGSDGQVLDPLGIALPAPPDEVYESLVVASDGADFMVVFRSQGTVRALRVGANGVVLDAASRLLASTHTVGRIQVSFGAGLYLVTFGDVYAVRVRPDGTVLDAEPIVVSTGKFEAADASSLYAGGWFYVFWTTLGQSVIHDEGEATLAARIDPATGVVIDPDGIEVAVSPGGYHSAPAAVVTGERVIVVWDENDYPTPYRSLKGAVLDAASGTLINDATSGALLAEEGNSSALAADGNTILLAHAARDGSARLRRFRADTLELLDLSEPGVPFALRDPAPRGTPAIAYAGGAFQLSWFEPLHGVLKNRLGAGDVDPEGGPYAIKPLVRANNVQFSPVIARGSSTALAVWEDLREGVNNRDLYAARVDLSTGALLDLQGIAVSTAPGAQRFPSVAFDGANYLVAWIDEREAYEYTASTNLLDGRWRTPRAGAQVVAARIRESDGALLDGWPASGGVRITALSGRRYFPVSVGYAAGQFLIAWGVTDELSDNHGELRAKRLRAADGLLQDGGLTSAGLFFSRLQESPNLDVVGGSDSFLLAGSLVTDPPSGQKAVHVFRVDAATGEIGALGNVGYAGGVASVATSFDGENYVLALSTLPAPGQVGTPYVLRVRTFSEHASSYRGRDEIVSESLAGSPISAWRSQVDVVFDGSNLVLAWEDTRGGIYTSRLVPTLLRPLDLQDGVVGVLLQSEPLRPTAQYERDRTWTLAAASENKVAIAYQGPSGSYAQYTNSRTLGRFFSFAP